MTNTGLRVGIGRKPPAPPEGLSELADWHADLAARFASRRCACGLPATVVAPGTNTLCDGRLLIKRSTPDRDRCLLHAGLGETRRVA
jgi:hypothetical protein